MFTRGVNSDNNDLNFANNSNSYDMQSFYANNTSKPTESFDFLEEPNSDWTNAPTIYIATSKPKTNIYLGICAVFTFIFILGSIIFWSLFLAKYAFHPTPTGTVEGPFSIIDKLSSSHDQYTLDFTQEEFGSSNYDSKLSISSSVRNIPASVYYYTLTFSGAKGGYINTIFDSSGQLCITMNTSISLASISSCEPASNFDTFGYDYSFPMSTNTTTTTVYFFFTIVQSPQGSDYLPFDIKFDTELWITEEDEEDYRSTFEKIFTIGIVSEVTIFLVLFLVLFTIIACKKKYHGNDTAYQTLSQSVE